MKFPLNEEAIEQNRQVGANDSLMKFPWTKSLIIIAIVVIILIAARSYLLKAAIAINPSAGLGTDEERNFLGNDNLPRGFRNNNPGNIKQTQPRQGWIGSVANPTDPVFEQFTYYSYGLRAMLKLMRNHINRGNNTITKLINVWAPTLENNTSAYINAVAEHVGISPHLTISALDKSIMFGIAQAIEIHENGYGIMNQSDFESAWQII